ncbi:MAG: endonuclease III [Thermoguttaceae bacterium]|nr:endonuclease III [Thermoguttaceae bacterium]
MPARPSSSPSVNSDELRRRKRILKKLNAAYPQVGCTLDHFNPFQLLIATILSAQCTDKRVNEVTPGLFKRFKTPDDFLRAGIPEIEDAIRSTGFYHNKAKNIYALCKRLKEDFHSEVPCTIDELVNLPGVGRKTANVVLGNAFGIVEGIVVDTHVGRISRKLGLTEATDPEKVERDLVSFVPKKEWVDFSHRLITHGRQICRARRPLCGQCPLASDCPSAEK